MTHAYPNLIWPQQLRTADIKFHENAFSQNEDTSYVQLEAYFKGNKILYLAVQGSIPDSPVVRANLCVRDPLK
jgi:hypothetical protein